MCSKIGLNDRLIYSRQVVNIDVTLSMMDEFNQGKWLNLVTCPEWSPMYEWRVVRCKSKTGQVKNYAFTWSWTTCSECVKPL